MKSNNIKSLNSAVYVMRHFVELSSKLLPYYERITRSEPHSLERIAEKKRIDEVYQKYNVNPKTSQFLLGSNIIALIGKVYDSLQERNSNSEAEAQRNLNEFTKEYHRLKKNWYQTLMN
jgi:hypothetical protein